MTNKQVLPNRAKMNIKLILKSPRYVPFGATLTKLEAKSETPVINTVTRSGPKVGQIGPKWDKSGKFSDQIQYILAHRAKMY